MSKDILEKFSDVLLQLDDNEKARFLDALHLKLNIKRPKLPPNVMLFQTAAYVCATNMSGAANKILMLFLSLTAYENVVGMDQLTIAEDLKMGESSVRRGLDELLNANVISKVKCMNDKRRNEYFLSPFGVWKGNSVQRNKLIRKMLGTNESQLSLFGVEAEAHMMREQLEIRDKRGFGREERLNKLLDSMSDPVTETDENGTVWHWMEESGEWMNPDTAEVRKSLD
tara:strand:- start:1474 stop:2154 length:681 start_codon:yes stop_codon:yes gene_type:complete